ncbi:MAG: exopolysaccharide biosynthesis protein [Pseudomonadota bacterium]
MSDAIHTNDTASPDVHTALDRVDLILARHQGRDAGASASSISLGDLSEAMEERAFGLLILALALPCCLPFIYIIPQIVALPMLVLTGQMAAGRNTPWLPQNLTARTVDIAQMRSIVARGKRWFGWAERIARPRLLALSGPKASRLVGGLLLIPSASILVPLPSTNTMPGIGVALASIGLIERDGLMILLGLFIGLAWVAFLLISAPLLAVWLLGLVGA